MATAAPPKAKTIDDGQRFVLYGVNWKVYNAILDALEDRPIRLTYDRGKLELMSPSHAHESGGHLLGRMIDSLTEEMNIPIKGGRSTTFRREDLDRGLEPDECYWIAHQPSVAGKRDIDLTIDPAPDLAIEVDITSSSIDRQGIYAALGVPELWRYDGERLTVIALQADGTYAPQATSLAFPFLPMAEVLRFLHEGETAPDETAWIRSFREWVRANLPGH
jgi:Uma2 family endonuclease